MLGWYTNGEVNYGIKIPDLLSLLSFHNANAVVRVSTPYRRRPTAGQHRPVFVPDHGRHRHVAGTVRLFFLFVCFRRRRLPLTNWFYWALAVAGPAATVALIAGWVTTEVGRQPWVVYQVMRTRTPSPARRDPLGYAVLATYFVVAGRGVDAMAAGALAAALAGADAPPDSTLQAA